MSRNSDEISTNSAGTLRLGGFVFDCDQGELCDEDGALVGLRNQSLRVLEFLALHNSAVVGKDDLLEAVCSFV